MFISHMPFHDHAILYVTSQGHGTARHGMACVNKHQLSRDGMWATRPRSASSGYHAEYHEGCYQKHTNLLNYKNISSDISG
jgi:microcystin-dependent protein